MIISPITAFLMILLNTVEIYFIIKQSRARKIDLQPFIYFLNLSASDIVLGVIILMVKILNFLEKRVNCVDIRMFLQNKALSLSLYPSILSIAALTIERMLAVSKPIFHKRITRRHKTIVCSLMWATTTTIIFTLHFTVKDDKLEYIVTPALIIATTVATVISYLMITKALNKRRQFFHKPHRKVNRFDKTEARYLRFCFNTFLMFLACWSPLTIFGIAFSSGLLHDCQYFLELRFSAHIVAFWNSILFPIFFLRHYRVLSKLRNDCMNGMVRMKQISISICTITRVKHTFSLAYVTNDEDFPIGSFRRKTSMEL